MVCMQVRLLGAEQIRGKEHYTAYKLQRLGDADKHGQREPEGEPLYRRFRQFVQLVASLLEVRAATPRGGGCNPMHSACQPHAPRLSPPCAQSTTPFALPSPGMYPGRRSSELELRAPGRASGRAARAWRRSRLKVPSW